MVSLEYIDISSRTKSSEIKCDGPASAPGLCEFQASETVHSGPKQFQIFNVWSRLSLFARSRRKKVSLQGKCSKSSSNLQGVVRLGSAVLLRNGARTLWSSDLLLSAQLQPAQEMVPVGGSFQSVCLSRVSCHSQCLKKLPAHLSP